MKNVVNFFRSLAIMLAVVVFASSCKEQQEVTPQAPVVAANGLSAEQQALVKSDPALTGIQANGGGFSTARAAAPGQCEGWTNSAKASWPTDFLNSDKVFTDFTGGMVIGGKNPVREVLPFVPVAEQTLSSGKFFDAFDCSKVATFSSLVWTKVGDKLVAGYFLDKTTSVSYTLIKGRDYTYNYDFVRVSCNQQTNVDGVVIPNTIAAFSIKFEVIPSGTTPVVVTPPTTGTGTVNLGTFLKVTSDSVKVDDAFVANNLRDGDKSGHYGVWQGVSTTIGKLFGLNEGNKIAPIPGREYNSAFDGINYYKFRAAFGISDSGEFGVTDGQTQKALADLKLDWKEISVTNSKAYQAVSGKYVFKAFYVNTPVTYEAYGIKFGKYRPLGFIVEEDGKVIHFSIGGWNK